ncbi:MULTISPECIES: hypothetical protein [Vibrio]|uniref:Uncharacterized protein n=1 Tax=Vibrio coralliilyticus TaxID=190893 RepID=A0AAP6ZIN8_9VIBR|nr:MULTISPECIES: hypothetical protein [Vibrio]MCM5509767.1 hypothetical protein [Vibrio sp. SCSIO 43169]NOH53231.1 hypothetical protein [Vibrio coralliilyticus]NOJ22175.1 hypothetical protein [Vibrio coralliilyticus]QFT35972.1 hypothetical protein FIU99_05985 [Vibrio sp. THAF64]QGM33872.1 hypothetical protein GGC04_05995 [Vibrio sp. THAF191d]
MNQTEVKALVVSLLDITGLKKILTSVSATLISFGVNDIAQLIAISVGIVSGVMAIRHYAVATKLNQAKLNKLNSQEDGAT